MASNSLFDQMQIRGYVQGWAKLTIERWQKELRKKKIGVTDELYNSFKDQVQSQQGELLGILFKFLQYGRFRDMNVGRGLKAYERGTNKQMRTAAKRYGANVSYVNRTEKRWLNRPKMAEIYRLRELLADKMSETVLKNISEIITSQT
ncbi:hypothetical protein [Pedobacter ginsengisoli]|uniref:hypothetical protein n=1 Tax=Pedobacter ginsengisoli TaxID=363852 RepID=UPI00254EC1AF|nr:hypothetical protein [Pedobacter ginsengisoli]